MRNLIKYALSALLGAALFCPAPVLAAGIFVDPCGNVDPFAGNSSAKFVCFVGANGQSISGGAGNAGLNFFENHISPVHLSGFHPADVATVFYVTTTFPTWTIPTVGTLLELDGRVKVADQVGASITLTLTGTLGGCVNAADCVAGSQQIGPITYGPGTSTDIALASVVEQFTAGLAIEILQIDITGNATYNVDGSPTFTGAPEPSSLVLLTAGLLLLGAGAVRPASARIRSRGRS